jgi:hypothetical protein
MSDESVNVEQGWSPADKTAWYTTNQGLRILPLSWLRALEQPDSEKPFLAPEHMAGFRFLPGPGASDLPIGFTIDAQDDSQLSITKLRWKEGQSSKEPWVGLTCPTLYDLLLPPSDRPKSFYVGTREFDPVKVGFKTEQSAENGFLFRVFDDQGKPIQGNLNSGHDYNNAGLSDADREAQTPIVKRSWNI